LPESLKAGGAGAASSTAEESDGADQAPNTKMSVGRSEECQVEKARGLHADRSDEKRAAPAILIFDQPSRNP